MAEDLGDKRAAGLMLEVDRLGKALFASRARLAGTEAVAQGLRRELERAAETIVDLSRSTNVSSPSPSAFVAPKGGKLGQGEGPTSDEAVAADGGGGESSRERAGGLTEEEALMIRSPSTSAAVATDSGGSGNGSTVPVVAVERAVGKGRAGDGGGIRKGSIHKLALAAGGLTRRAASSKMAARSPSKSGVSDAETAAASATRQEADASGSVKKANRAQSPPREARQPQKAAAYDVEL